MRVLSYCDPGDGVLVFRLDAGDSFLQKTPLPVRRTAVTRFLMPGMNRRPRTDAA